MFSLKPASFARGRFKGGEESRVAMSALAVGETYARYACAGRALRAVKSECRVTYIQGFAALR